MEFILKSGSRIVGDSACQSAFVCLLLKEW